MDSAPITSQAYQQQASPRRGLPEFSDLVLACRYHPFKTLAFGALTSLLFAALACSLVYPTYEAESLVRVKQHQDVIYVEQSSRSDDLAFVHSQEQLALSQPVLATALADADLQMFSEYIPFYGQSEWLKERVRVDMQVGSEVLTIAAKHPVPQVSQAICNALTNAYLREITERQKSAQDRRQAELESAAQEAERRLNELWAELNEVAIEVGSENTQSLTIRDEIQLQAYRDYAQQLRALQLRGHELASQFKEAQIVAQESQANASQEEINSRIENDSQVVIARQSLAAMDGQIRHMRELVAHDDSPRLKRLQADRDYYAQESERVVQEAIQRIRRDADNDTRGQAAASTANLQKQIELNESEKEYLRQRLSEIDASTDRKNKHSGLQLEVARHEVDRQARLTDGLWSSLEELKIERQSQSRVQLLQLADVPDCASYDKQLKAIAAVVASCWIITILGTGYFEWRNCTIRHLADVIENSHFPVFGDVERSAPTGLSRNALVKHTTGAQQAVAQMLLSIKQGQHLPTLMVTSATAEEPRHLLAIDLAVAFAALHYKTLLIDFDTTFGRLSRELKCDSVPGVKQIDLKRVTPCRFVLKTSSGIDFLPLGNKSAEAPWINPHMFADVLQEVRREYQAIVVAGPPVLDAAEGLINAAQVEQMVFCVCGGVSHWNELAQAEEAALRAGLACFGAVIHSDHRRQAELLGELRPPASADEELITEVAVQDDLSDIAHEILQAVTYQEERPHKDAIKEHHYMSSVQDTTRSRRGVRRPKRVSIDHAAGSVILRLDAAHPAQQTNAFVVLAPYFDIKPMVDRAITAGLMLVALPIMAVVGLSVLALDGRPVFYRQKRVGKNGRLFRIWKFRTMRPDAESRTGAVWSCQADPRVTKLGQWLRSSHLDELPQLFNVLAGDMNLIGPRPERPEFVSELEQQLACYSQRIKVAPGITGLAQIRTGYDHCVADVSRKVDIDLEYLRGASFWSDMKLLADTGLYILRHLWDTRMRVNRETAARELTDKHAAEEAAYVGPSSLVGVGVGQAVRRSVPFTGTAVAADGESSAIERLTQLVHEIEECS